VVVFALLGRPVVPTILRREMLRVLLFVRAVDSVLHTPVSCVLIDVISVLKQVLIVRKCHTNRVPPVLDLLAAADDIPVGLDVLVDVVSEVKVALSLRLIVGGVAR